ncbi:MAG: hypothetical protein AAB663_00500, partial [Patescibacteria group bacterium]
MLRIALIPGYATELATKGFRSARATDAGFTAFRTLINQAHAVTFRWGIPRTLSFFATLALMPILTLYRNEEQHAITERTMSNLKTFLTTHQPEVIVAHSLGARLLMEYCHRHTLPASVKRVVLCQADMPTVTPPLHHHVEILHVYCPWDPSLILSSILHSDVRAGLRKMAGVRNILIPLWRPINFHTSSIRDARLVDLALETLGNEAPRAPLRSARGFLAAR